MKCIRCLLIVIILISASALAGCGNKGGKLQEIRITPQNRIIATGTDEQFSSMAIFGDGTVVNWTSATLWSTAVPSPDPQDLVRISNSFDTYGFAQSISYAPSGTVIITGTDTANNVSSTATLEIVDPFALLIYPPRAFMKVNTAHPFRADAILTTDPAFALTSDATYTTQYLTSRPTTSWWTDNANVLRVGKHGEVTTLTTGTANLYSSYTFSSRPTGTDSRTGFTTITVTLTSLQTISISPTDPGNTKQYTIASSPSSTIQFTATGNYFTDNLFPDFTESVNWTSSNKKIAVISNVPGFKGLCTLGTVTGSTVINATDPINGVTRDLTLKVTP